MTIDVLIRTMRTRAGLSVRELATIIVQYADGLCLTTNMPSALIVDRG